MQSTDPIVSDGRIGQPIMVISRDSGKDEIIQKKPLIGRDGQVFRVCLDYFDLTDQVYMTNLVPYKLNRNIVFPEKIRESFIQVLWKQIIYFKPKIILTLGRHAFTMIVSITSMHEPKKISIIDRIWWWENNTADWKNPL